MKLVQFYNNNSRFLCIWNSKLEVNTKQLSLLTDKDLEMLGIKDAKTRKQMLTEFAELPNQEHLELT